VTVRISVLVNSYLRVTYLEEALKSVLQQDSTRPFEVVLVCAREDWSIPRQVEQLARDRGIEIRRVTVPPSPVGTGLRMGVAATRGDVVAILDDDDLWEAGKVLAVERAFDQNRELSLLHNGQTFVDGRGRPLSPLNPHRFIRHPSSLLPEGRRCLTSPADPQGIARLLSFEPGFNNSSMSIRRSTLESLGGAIAPLRGGEDTFLFLFALASGGTLLALSDRLTRYRIHFSGSSGGTAHKALVERGRGYATYMAKHLESLNLARRLLPNELGPVVSSLLAREESYYSIMQNLLQPENDGRSNRRDIGVLLSVEPVPPSLRNLLASLLAATRSVSASWARLNFLAWRMAW
jgi:hypothetical protein